MREKKQTLKKMISFLLSLVIIMGMIPTVAFAQDSVVTDSTDFDVFMNVDASLGIDSTAFKNKVSGYLNTLLSDGEENKSYRIEATAATIDPTDITKWEVYSHYDTQWFANETAWKTSYNGGVIPANWYYSPVTDRNVVANSSNVKTTLKDMLSDPKATGWGKTAGLESHIYAYLENGKPAMQFYGYGTSYYADFLYYPASATSTKTVKFDVDATKVLTHSLKYAGFLINAGTTGTGSTKTMDGYAILFEYGPANSATAATELIGAYLYQLNGVNVDKLHAEGLRGISSGASKVETSSFSTLYPQSRIELSITPTGLTATIQQLGDKGQLTGSKTYLFGDSETSQVLNSTGFGGFGPYVDFGVSTGHDCGNTSSFRYSNLEMSFSEALSGSSALEAYQYADYLNESGQKFFVNLTSSGENYTAPAMDTDNAYVTRIAADKTILITDEYTDTYLPDALGENAKSVYDTRHVKDDDISGLKPGTDPTEILAAKVAWLIYHANHSENGGSVTPPTTVTIASLLLLDRAPWAGAKQVNQIKKELMDAGGLKVYLNPDNSINATGLTATYKLTNPSGVTTTLSPETDEVSGKQYFTVPNSWAPGEYTVTLSYATSESITSTVPATATFSILTDTMAPSVSATITGSTAALTFTNTQSTGSTGYTSELDSYAAVISTDNTRPTDPAYTSVSGTSATMDIGNKTTGNYYLHMFLKDAAANVGYASKAFIVTGPTVAFTTPATNNYTSKDRYEDDSITFSLTRGTYDIKSYQIGTGDDTAVYDTVINTEDKASVEYQLPVGVNRIWAKAIDTAGNESTPISIYVDAKKFQVLSGTREYTLEAGIDKTVILDYTAASNPVLGEGESLGTITYAEFIDSNGSISLTSGIVTIGNYTGEATVRVTAAATATHREASEEITVNVVKPFSVSLVTNAYDAGGITVVPGYNDEGKFGVSNERELKYRKVGTSTWTTIAVDGWSWGNGCKIPFSGLTPGAEYEVMLSGQNTRTVPTQSTETLSFKVPTASSAKGEIEVGLEDTESGGEYHVSVRSGDTVLYSDTITGNSSDKNYRFTNLPDGFYNVVVEYEGETVTKLVEIRDGAQIPDPLSVKVKGFKNTRVLLGNEVSPKVAVDGLNELFIDGTTNTDDAAGVTIVDNAVLAGGGSIVIDLVSTGLKETEVPEDAGKIRTVSNGQTLAMVVDLSLYKTIRKLNAIKGAVSRLTSTPSRITVAVPLEPISGTGIRAYRVHDGAAQIIPQAVANSAGPGYVWAEQYTLGGTTLTKGAAVGAGDEFVAFTTGYAIFHVNKFSTYAIGYTRYASNPVTNPTIVKDTANGAVTVSSATQEPGKTVTVTAKPKDGYVLGNLRIVDANGTVITYRKTSDGVYQFTMPASTVSVTASFVKKVAAPQETGVAQWLITDDHISYMRGDDYGRFNPDEKMSRAEVAQMFYNLLREKDVTISAGFTDLPDAAWYRRAVETLASMGIITGYNGKYRPEEPITRAEFTAIAMRFAKYIGGTARFSDVSSGNWAYSAIMSAAGYGWITGYADGTFKPDAYIKRAEVVTIVNHMLGRNADKEYISSKLRALKIFPDAAQSSYWAYYDIIEATNGHDFKVSDIQETWMGVH